MGPGSKHKRCAPKDAVDSSGQFLEIFNMKFSNRSPIGENDLGDFCFVFLFVVVCVGFLWFISFQNG